MNHVKIKQFETVYKAGKTQITGTFDGNKVTFFFGTVKVGFGIRHYFICPVCGHNQEKLTFDGAKFACFRCVGVNPYSGIQTTTRGGDEFIAYKMQRFAEKHRIENFRFPFDYCEYPRPYRRKAEKWHNAIKILQALESMRFQSIVFGKVWDAATIKSVENGTNPYLSYSVNLLCKYCYPFDGKAVNVGELYEKL